MHLSRRDKQALAFRIAGAVAGFGLIAFAFAKSSWDKPWILMLFAVVVVGGAVSYHLMTSIVSCPSCGESIVNIRIGQVEDKRKVFTCRRCGTTAWLTEEFYWQEEING